MIVHENKKYKSTFSLILVVVMVLLTVSIAYAAFITINTDDGNVDSNWSATPFRDDVTGDASANYDIDKFWVSTNANPPTEFYFRADLVGTLPLDGSIIEAQLDCNGDGDFYQAVDVLVDYYPDLDYVEVLQGDISSFDTLGATLGEILSDGNYEWRAPASGTNVDWSACPANPLNVRLAILDASWNYVDYTDARGYNVPTVVSLSNFSAKQPTGSLPLTALMLAIVCGSGVIILLRQVQKRRCIE